MVILKNKHVCLVSRRIIKHFADGYKVVKREKQKTYFSFIAYINSENNLVMNNDCLLSLYLELF